MISITSRAPSRTLNLRLSQPHTLSHRSISVPRASTSTARSPGLSVTALRSSSNVPLTLVPARPFSESGLWGFIQGLFKRQARFFKEAHNARIEAETDIMFNRKGPVDETVFRRLSVSPTGDLSLYNLTLDTRSIQAQNVRLGGGSYVTGYVRCSGACTIEDDAATTLGGVKAKSLAITGRGDTSITYSINAEQIRFQGNLTVGDSIKCFSIKGGGIVKVGTNISGSEVQLVTIGGVSTANVIFGSSMVELDALSWDSDHKKVVDKSHSWVEDIKHLRLPHGSPKFKVDKVIGERVHINNVTALTVRGRHVTIGKDCDILTVEYSHSMKIHPEASVRNIAHRPTMRVQMDQDDIDELPDGS